MSFSTCVTLALLFVSACSAYSPITRPVRWGIMGAGRIASDFTGSLTIAGSKVNAVAAGSLPNTDARAQAFAKTWSIPKAYGSYELLANDSEVDIVYIATVNFLHYDCAKMMLNAGKHVLLEKPATMDTEHLIELQKLAREKDVFFAVNFWTRQFPVVKWMRQLIASGHIGDLVQINGDISFYRPDTRLINRTMGGGSLMDVGCYQIQYATMFNGGKFPDQIQASAKLNDQGVDADLSMTLSWGDSSSKTMATFTAGFDKYGGSSATFIGTKGRIELRENFNNPDTAYVFSQQQVEGVENEVTSELSFTFNEPLPPFPTHIFPSYYPQPSGFTYTVSAVERALLAGETFLKEISPEEQVVVMKIADAVRHKVGVYWDYETPQKVLN